MTSTRATCARTRLAAGKQSTIDLCSCGTYHLTMGPITLRVDDQTLVDLLSTLNVALSARRMTLFSPEVRVLDPQ